MLFAFCLFCLLLCHGRSSQSQSVRVPNSVDERELFERPIATNGQTVDRRDMFDLVSVELERKRPMVKQWIKEECMLGAIVGASCVAAPNRDSRAENVNLLDCLDKQRTPFSCQALATAFEHCVRDKKVFASCVVRRAARPLSRLSAQRCVQAYMAEKQERWTKAQLKRVETGSV